MMKKISSPQQIAESRPRIPVLRADDGGKVLPFRLVVSNRGIKRMLRDVAKPARHRWAKWTDQLRIGVNASFGVVSAVRSFDLLFPVFAGFRGGVRLCEEVRIQHQPQPENAARVTIDLRIKAVVSKLSSDLLRHVILVRIRFAGLALSFPIFGPLCGSRPRLKKLGVMILRRRWTVNGVL